MVVTYFTALAAPTVIFPQLVYSGAFLAVQQHLALFIIIF